MCVNRRPGRCERSRRPLEQLGRLTRRGVDVRLEALPVECRRSAAARLYGAPAELARWCDVQTRSCGSAADERRSAAQARCRPRPTCIRAQTSSSKRPARLARRQHRGLGGARRDRDVPRLELEQQSSPRATGTRERRAPRADDRARGPRLEQLHGIDGLRALRDHGRRGRRRADSKTPRSGGSRSATPEGPSAAALAASIRGRRRPSTAEVIEPSSRNASSRQLDPVVGLKGAGHSRRRSSAPGTDRRAARARPRGPLESRRSEIPYGRPPRRREASLGTVTRSAEPDLRALGALGPRVKGSAVRRTAARPGCPSVSTMYGHARALRSRRPCRAVGRALVDESNGASPLCETPVHGRALRTSRASAGPGAECPSSGAGRCTFVGFQSVGGEPTATCTSIPSPRRASIVPRMCVPAPPCCSSVSAGSGAT